MTGWDKVRTTGRRGTRWSKVETDPGQSGTDHWDRIRISWVSHGTGWNKVGTGWADTGQYGMS